MEELVASMNRSVHGGSQGCELSALQDQLSKTLAYGSNAYTFARQMSFESPATDSRQHCNSSDLRFPPVSVTKPARPNVTPTASFRGAIDWGGHTGWTSGAPEDSRSVVAEPEQRQQSAWSSSAQAVVGEGGDGMEVVNEMPTKSDDYSAFDQDAFAAFNSTPAGTKYLVNGSTDPWAAFRPKVPPSTTQHAIPQQDRSQGINHANSWPHHTSTDFQQQH